MSGHRPLVVEDDPGASEIVCALLRSLGDFPRAVATVEEALAAIEVDEFCYFVLDQQLPLNAADPKAFITGGDRVTRAARQSDLRRCGDGGAHVTPILALSGYSTRPEFLTTLYKLGVDTFVEKEVQDRVEYFSAEVREMLAKAGRDDHAKCAALARRKATTATAAAEVRLAIVGKATRSGRTAVAVNGEPREMQDSRFIVVLRGAVARERSIESWTSRAALGIGESRSATTEIRQTFEGLVPDGFEVLEGDRRGNFRLNPAIVLEPIEWDVLAEHPDPGIAGIARERRKRR